MFCSSVWYCWWFRTPACTQWVGHLYPHYFLPGFSTIQTLVGSGISEPSTEFSEIWALPADFANVETSSCNFFFRCTKTLRFLTASEAWRGRGIATTNPCLQGAQVGNASWWEPAWGASLQKTSISSGPMMGFYYGHLFSDCHWYILGWYPHWLGRGGGKLTYQLSDCHVGKDPLFSKSLHWKKTETNSNCTSTGRSEIRSRAARQHHTLLAAI